MRSEVGSLIPAWMGHKDLTSFPYFNAFTVEFITLKPVELFAGMRTVAAADLGTQNADSGNQTSLPEMDAAPSTALTIKANLSGQAKAASTVTLIETFCSRILHLMFNDSPLKQPTCTCVIFLKVNLLILQTCPEGKRQFAGRLGRKKVPSFLMKSIFIEGEGRRNELQNSEEPMRLWREKRKQEKKEKGKKCQ